MVTCCFSTALHRFKSTDEALTGLLFVTCSETKLQKNGSRQDTDEISVLLFRLFSNVPLSLCRCFHGQCGRTLESSMHPFDVEPVALLKALILTFVLILVE